MAETLCSEYNRIFTKELVVTKCKLLSCNSKDFKSEVVCNVLYFFFRNLRMSDKEGSGSEGSLEEENYEVEEIREKMRGDDGEWLYYVKVSHKKILNIV